MTKKNYSLHWQLGIQVKEAQQLGNDAQHLGILSVHSERQTQVFSTLQFPALYKI